MKAANHSEASRFGQILQLLPLALAGGTLPLLATVGIVLGVLGSGILVPLGADLDHELSALFSIAGMGLGCVVTTMWSWRSTQRHLALFKVCSVLSAIASVVLLGIIGDAIASQVEETYGDYYVEHAIFLTAPLVIICMGLLSFALRNVRSTAIKLLLLGAFMVATIVVQLSLLRENLPNPEMLIWNFNSLLVGLAFAIWLVAWSMREFRQT